MPTFIKAGVSSVLMSLVDAHGWITNPMSRIELVTHHWQEGMPDSTLRYCPSCSAGPNACGSEDANFTKPMSLWQSFYDSAGISVPSMMPRQEIEFNMKITADHGGQGWMLLSCDDEYSEGDAWHIIERASSDHSMPSTPKSYVWAMGASGGELSIRYLIPNEFSCPSGHGLGRWVWKTAHQCNDADNIGRFTEPFSLQEFQEAIGKPVLEKCEAVPAEEFIMCFDFTTAVGPSPPGPAPTPVTTRAPLGPCHAVSPSVTDDWCEDNCHAHSPNCPPDLCSCDSTFQMV